MPELEFTFKQVNTINYYVLFTSGCSGSQDDQDECAGNVLPSEQLSPENSDSMTKIYLEKQPTNQRSSSFNNVQENKP